MTLGEQIRQAREEKNLSQEELADRLGVSRQAVSKWENDNSVPQGVNRELLMQILGLKFIQDTDQEQGTEQNHDGGWRRKKSSVLNHILIAGMALFALAVIVVLLYVLLIGKGTPEFQCIRFYDSNMQEVEAEAAWYNAAQIACIYVQWKGDTPDTVKIFSTPSGSDLLKETELLLTQIMLHDENFLLLSAEPLKNISQGHIFLGLDYGDNVVISETFNLFFEEASEEEDEQGDSVSRGASDFNKYETEKNTSSVIVRNKQEIIDDIARLIQTAESDRYILGNFELEVAEVENNRADCVFRADWKSIRTPEEDPFIQGMYQAMEALTEEDEIRHAEEIIDGWLVEMNSWPEEERLDTRIVIQLDDTDCWILYYPYVMDGVEELIPLSEYVEENWTEDAEERRRQGVTIISDEMEWMRNG
ncbi:MAG: helix-turn-helix domain-containing protein [Roseburia sp.]|nr:helix-turn-helix domain-containing protein [Roseburia sp.]MCM1098104.1 helix-turn-helix domain-containing protein [Ruminococcus flavefaciens]